MQPWAGTQIQLPTQATQRTAGSPPGLTNTAVVTYITTSG